jgi:glycerate 2-kinase
VNVLCAPASLKGVLTAAEAAAALAQGVREAGGAPDELPIADGGEGTAAALHAALGGVWHEADVDDPLGRPIRARWLLLPDGTAVVESSAAAGLPLLAPGERDPLRASTRGLGLLLQAVLRVRPLSLLVALGGVGTVDGGAGLREVVDRLPVPTRVACDVRNPLLGARGAARAYGPQKGASPGAVEELERRLAADEALRPYAELPGAGAAGGLGAALAALGGELVAGAPLVLETLRFRERARGAGLVVTGEGSVDATTSEGKAPGEAARIAREEGVRCVVFGGTVVEPLAGADCVPLSGHPDRAARDLVQLGARLAA